MMELRKSNPKLKVMLGVDGGRDGDLKFSKMVESLTCIKANDIYSVGLVCFTTSKHYLHGFQMFCNVSLEAYCKY